MNFRLERKVQTLILTTEREAILENLTKDIATIITEKCVDPTTKLPSSPSSNPQSLSVWLNAP